MPSIPRKPTTFLIQAFDLSAWPVVLFGEGNTVRYLNTAAEKALGILRDELLEQTARYHGLGQLPKAMQQVSDLCPASNVWLGEVATRDITLASGGDATETSWRGVFYPITDAPDTASMALVRNVVVMLAPPDKFPHWGPLQPQEEIHATLQSLRHEYRGRYSVSHLVGVSTAMIRVRRLVDLASQSRVPVLVIGEQGTGREQVARTICYASSPGHAGPVITIEGELMDAEIMQTTIRAFANRCEDDEDGGHASLVLLNAEKLDLGAQTELLHLLDLIGVELRILSTAEESLLELARRGQFREDLAFRISTLEIELPPLCDRPEDIPYIAQAVVEELNIPSDRQLQSISAEAIDRLQQQEWPGNIDQLNEMLTGAHQTATGFTLDVTDFPVAVSRGPHKKLAAKETESISLDAALEAYERGILERTLKAAKGNKTQAANMLGISRARLHRRIEQWGLE
ncbi:sigma 54-interacting transcriptional regulator [Bremerella alba]|uniref:Anaerobic nitric oxide reductase transcription regulator NorR n=1 Tax=Bremerella alba TaxID=980252 RepID=A0A7V8V8L0_9BACT|nr:sigma 54-interacting transcriptional regulator [Bremerella alba]MBA2116969.1 Anaerobic nitric oxide reductase transcription regulator NorR [Bremerella alba]